MTTTSTANHRYLLFGTELYALPILLPLAAAIVRRGCEVAWFLHGVDAKKLPGDQLCLDSAAAVRDWRPEAVFAASNWVPDFFPGLKVQVFHGFSVDKRNQQRGHFRIRGLFDLYCTQGPATTGEFQRLEREHPHFRTVETGWPKLDPLFAPMPQASDLRPGDGRPVVAFGSTFTESLSCAATLYPQIARLVEQGQWYWLLTLHPKCAPELFGKYRALAGPNARFVESDQLLPLLRNGDVLLSDTSSIVEEFAVQIKPVVTFRNRSPKPHRLDFDEPERLEHMLQLALSRPADLIQALEQNAMAIHPYRDGRASERVLDAAQAMLADGRAGLERKPLNLWRKLQMRQRLNYWRF